MESARIESIETGSALHHHLTSEQLSNSSQILRKQKFCVISFLFDGELSEMHHTEVHVFSDSVSRVELARNEVHQKVK